MDEELSWALPDALDDTHIGAPAHVRLGSPPATRDEILAQVGLARLAVYDLVRTAVDEFERVAPWRVLYYPPQDQAAFVTILTALIELIEGIPKRVAATLTKLPKGAPSSDDEPTREDIRFMFSGIHHMVAHELRRLQTTLGPVQERGSATADERQLLCELSADLKGKYASSMMGAAASLIAQGLWNGVEVEPILFPEKAEEFRNTRELVDLLREVSDSIRQLPEQLHFKELVEGWEQGSRADQYALADLPSLRGKIAKLLKERTRRALYSGDYHQISRREVLLSERINEMENLHQRTWSTDHGNEDLAPTLSRLIQLTLEMAAILDVTILKALIGEKKVEGLRARVTMAKTRPVSSASTPGVGLDSLLPLLREDDLRIFLDLLLGAVMRRASLTVTMRGEMEQASPFLHAPTSQTPVPASPIPPPMPPVTAPVAPAPAAPVVPVPPSTQVAPPGGLLPDVDEWALPPPKAARDWTNEVVSPPPPSPLPSRPASPAAPSWKPEPSAPLPEPTVETWTPSISPTLDWLQNEPDPAPAPPSPSSPTPSPFSAPSLSVEPGMRSNLRPSLKTVSDVLNDLLAATNTSLSSFKMTQRLLSKHARIPAAMLQSTHPYLQEVQERLVPVLRQITPFHGITDEAVKKLETYCRDLRRADLSPSQLKDDIPKKMERLLLFLGALRSAVPNL